MNALLRAALLAPLLVAGKPEAGSAPATTGAHEHRAAHTANSAPPQAAVRDRDAIPDLFAPTTWTPPVVAVPAAPPPPPPAPVAPPLPFQLAGAVETENAKTVYYLVQGDQSYPVSVGDTFAGQYRLESVEANRLVIVYLPLQQKQYLALSTDS